MVFINPKKFLNPEKSERIFSDLTMYGRAYTTDMKLAGDIAKRKEIREATEFNFLDIAHNRRKSRTVFVLPPDITLVPRASDKGIRYYFKRFKIFE